ncbi:GlcG/HbpS family heme-binding protein [Streptomyces niveus]
MTIQLESLSLDDAQRVITAAREKAGEIESPSNVAVVDIGGNLVSHIRMDDAWVGSVDISINKAFTARAFDIATKGPLGQRSARRTVLGIQGSNQGRVMIFAGGIPLRHDGHVVGAVGVSGGSGEQDQAVAEAAVAAF